MSIITEPELEFARRHTQLYYASDFLPDPDELGALWSGWQEVIDYHASSSVADLGSLPLELPALKATGGYRIVHQMTPLDGLTYSALARRIAPLLEAKRTPLSEGTVCSYRIDVDEERGRFFVADSRGYAVFRSRSVSLAQSKAFVLLLDIASFYNQIYLHRVQGAVEQLDSGLTQLSLELEQFLLNVNKRVSIGIPIGPAASIVVAEVILHDIDGFLRRASKPGTEYTRYVDDFRVFSDSRGDLEQIWHDLSRYLYRAHRLSLANDKCRLMESSEFRDAILDNERLARQRDLARRVGISLDELSADYAVPEQVEPPPPTGKAGKKGRGAVPKTPVEGHREALRELMAGVLAERPMPIGVARKTLRKARSLRIKAILPEVLANIAPLAPVVRDVGLYLREVLRGKTVERNRQHLAGLFATHPAHIPGSLTHEWLSWLITGDAALAAVPEAALFLASAPRRFACRLAVLQRNVPWVRERASEWTEVASWDRWALLNSAVVLPTVERRVWMDHVLSGSQNLMDQLMAKHVKGRAG